MEKIDIWNIETNINTKELIEYLIDHKTNNTYLLDLSKNNDDFSVIEKIVFNIANFHFDRLKITNNMFVEFWWKLDADTDNFHLDCDECIKFCEGQYIHPILSCVTYLNNNNCPTIITNVKHEDYKYKQFANKNFIYMSFPKEWKHITFDSKLFHGISNIYDKNENINPRYMLAINLWNKQPKNVDYYNIKNNNSTLTFKFNIFNNNILKIINVKKNLIDFNLFENLLYKKQKDLFKDFKKYIDENKDFDTFKLIRNDNEEKEKLESKLKNKYGDIIEDVNAIMNLNSKFIKYNRFLQRFHYNKVYSPEVCKWIINECELYAVNNGGWTTKRHNNYPTTDLPVDKVKPIFNFVIETLQTISKKISTSYCLNENITFNFKDTFVVKYKYDEQSHLDLHYDGSFLSFQILLSEKCDFEGGGTYFDDGLIMKPEQGDLIIHSSRINHSGLPITKGTRYLLVGFIDLNLTIET